MVGLLYHHYSRNGRESLLSDERPRALPANPRVTPHHFADHNGIEIDIARIISSFQDSDQCEPEYVASSFDNMRALLLDSPQSVWCCLHAGVLRWLKHGLQNSDGLRVMTNCCTLVDTIRHVCSIDITLPEDSLQLVLARGKLGCTLVRNRSGLRVGAVPEFAEALGAAQEKIGNFFIVSLYFFL
jgi:hypothetical protein